MSKKKCLQQKHNISWTDQTVNPVTGCSKVSAGCTNCYAESISKRFHNNFPIGFNITLRPGRLIDLFFGHPRKIFMNSMSDLFHDDVPKGYLKLIYEIMKVADWNIYQILTKRPENMKQLYKKTLKEFKNQSHIWVGVTVENKEEGIPRIEILRNMDLPVKFVSAEPLLEDLGKINLSGIQQLIVGGENGIKARPIEKAWIYSLEMMCRKYKTAFFFKQWGGKGGRSNRLLDGIEYNEFPFMEPGPTPSKGDRTSNYLYALNLILTYMETDEFYDFMTRYKVTPDPTFSRLTTRYREAFENAINKNNSHRKED